MRTTSRYPGSMKSMTDRRAGVNRRNRGRAFLGSLCAAALALLAIAGGASAHLFYPYQYQTYFDGHDATAGAVTPNMTSMTIDQTTGRVYLMDQHSTEAEISQFKSDGEAVPFPALSGSSTIQNTGGPAVPPGGYTGGSLQWD